jgi:hypothetical protein
VDEREYALAVFPPQVRCVGLPLQPYALGHRVLLHAIGSGFVVGDRVPTFDDLISSVWICAHTWEENISLLRSPIRNWLHIKTWGLFKRRFDIVAEMATFARYIRESDTFPEVDAPKDPVKLESAWTARLEVFLRSRGFTESEAMNMPIAKGGALYAADNEEQGRIKLMPEQTKTLIEMAKEMA